MGRSIRAEKKEKAGEAQTITKKPLEQKRPWGPA